MKSSDKLEKFFEEIEPYLILVIISSFVGVVCGVLGALFIKTIDIFVTFREISKYLILSMPIVGLLIVYINRKYKCQKEGTELVNNAILKQENIPSYVAPTLFITTTLSHLVGASIGRMEAPIKIGGCIGNHISDFFNLTKKYRNTIIASGVSGLFGAVFGAPVTGTIFAYEVCYTKENKKPIYLLPTLLSAAFGRFICFAFGLNSFIDNMLYLTHGSFKLKEIFLIAVLIVLCLLFTLLFNKILKGTKDLFSKIKNEYIRIVIGSLLMIGAIIILDTTLFCGNNTNLVKQSLIDNSMWYIFIVKALLTSLCLAVGFKGGNIGPTFIVGVTFGILLANLMGLDPMLGASIGAVALFGGITGCFISAIFLGIEIFGFNCLIFYILIAVMLHHLIKNDYIKRSF